MFLISFSLSSVSDSESLLPKSPSVKTKTTISQLTIVLIDSDVMQGRKPFMIERIHIALVAIAAVTLET